MSWPPARLKVLATEIVGLLKERKESVAVAETAAGGLISASLLSVPGASHVYKGGLTVYTLDSRVAFCGWTQANIQAYDGPTAAVVRQLAVHTRSTLQPTWALAESGTAGPKASGKGENRQPGWVAIAVAGPLAEPHTRETTTGSVEREQNMVLFAELALAALRDVIKDQAGPSVSSSSEEKI